MQGQMAGGIGAGTRHQAPAGQGGTPFQSGSPATFSQTVTLDVWTRMTSAVDPDGGTEADQYDPAGNRTAITATTALATMTTNYRYDAADQLTTSGTAGTDSQGHHIYGPILGYGYDGQGDRLRSYEQGTPTWTLRNDAQDLVGGLASLVSDGQADYTYLNPGAGQAPLAGYTQSTTRTTYLGSDLLGSVRLATDPTGAVIGSGGYDAWGNARPYQGSSGPTLLAGLQGSSPFGYAGQYLDAGPGTYAMRAREYSPTLGRFQSVDPLVARTGEPYVYALDSPVGNADPSGLEALGQNGMADPGQVPGVFAALDGASQPGSSPDGSGTLNPEAGSRLALFYAIGLYRHLGYTIFSGDQLYSDRTGTNSQLGVDIGRLILAKNSSTKGADFIAYKWMGSDSNPRYHGKYRVVAVEVKWNKYGNWGSGEFITKAYGGKYREGGVNWENEAAQRWCSNTPGAVDTAILQQESCFWLNPTSVLSADATANNYACNHGSPPIIREADFVGVSGRLDNRAWIRSDISGRDPGFTYTTLFSMGGQVVSPSRGSSYSHPIPGSAGYSIDIPVPPWLGVIPIVNGKPASDTARLFGITLQNTHHFAIFGDATEEQVQAHMLLIAFGVPGMVKSFRVDYELQYAKRTSAGNDDWHPLDDGSTSSDTVFIDFQYAHDVKTDNKNDPGIPRYDSTSQFVRLRFWFKKTSEVQYEVVDGPAIYEGALALSEDTYAGPSDIVPLWTH